MQIIKKKQKEIDFYARYFYDPKAEERKRLLLTAGLPIFVILLVILGIFCGLKISDAVHKHEISKMIPLWRESIRLYQELRLFLTFTMPNQERFKLQQQPPLLRKFPVLLED